MIIRRATSKDINEVIEVWKLSGLLIRPKGRDDPNQLIEQLNYSNLWILVAEIEQEILGVVLVTHDCRKGWINRLAVRPLKMRQGIATKLLKAAEESLFEIGIEVIALLISEDNIPSRSFFEKQNYHYHKDITYYSKRISEDS